jgi:hypothetical protein
MNWNFADVKNRFSELLSRARTEGPTIRGRRTACECTDVGNTVNGAARLYSDRRQRELACWLRCLEADF